MKRVAQRVLRGMGLEVRRTTPWLDSLVNSLRPGWEPSELIANQRWRPDELHYSAPPEADKGKVALAVVGAWQ